MTVRHTLLSRQLKRHLCCSSVPPELDGFMRAVDEAYREFDADRRMLERSLELSSQELMQATSEVRTVVQAIPDLIFRIDADGTVRGCQPVSPHDGAAGTSDLVSRKMPTVPCRETVARLEEPIRRVRETHGPVTTEYGLEIGGEQQWFEARLVPLLDDRIIVVVRNVTERKRMEDERIRLSKLDSMSVLAGGVAHDFNNILAAIVGNLSFALTARRPDLQHEVLSDVQAAAFRAQKLVAQLATFSRGGMPIRKVADIAPLLRQSTEFALSGSNVTCEFEISPELAAVSVDEGQIGQVIDNLVINAQQAMPCGGTLRVCAENVVVSGDDAVARLAVRPGRYVRIVVEDHGAGIPAAHLPRIFDPYFTTKEKGSGLGLATAYSIVKRHDGHVSVESEVGRGTTFTILLPASGARPELACVPRPPSPGRGLVLLMDDEQMIRDGTGRMLRHLGYTVALARDGEEAVATYRRAVDRGEPFDVVIMDLTIPAGMGGKETLAALRSLDPGVTAVVSSGYSDEPIVAAYREHGFAGVLPKPYTIGELAEVLREVASTREVASAGCARAG